jgi:hypothetical protein
MKNYIKHQCPYLIYRVPCLEVGDPKCINFVSLEDYRRKMAKEYRIPIYRCLLEGLEIDGYVTCTYFHWLKHIVHSFPHFKLQNLQVLKCILKKPKNT